MIRRLIVALAFLLLASAASAQTFLCGVNVSNAASITFNSATSCNNGPGASFDSSRFSTWLVVFHNVIETNPTVFGPQFVMTFSADGTTFDAGPHYGSTIAYSADAPPQPTNPYGLHAAHYIASATGIYISLDNPGMMSQGYSGTLTIHSPGIVSGRSVDTTVEGMGSRGTSASDAMPFGHFNFGRWTGALGSSIKGIRVANNQQNFSGRIELWGYDQNQSAAPSWTPYTPLVTASSGVLASTTASGSYWTDGKSTQFQATVTIADKGTGDGVLLVTLPSTPYPADFYFPAGEHGNSGVGLKGHVLPGSNLIEVLKLDNTSIIANGRVVSVSGGYRNP